MLTKTEWQKHAETAAAHKYGEDHAGFYVWRRRLMGPWGAIGGLAIVGLGVRWLVHNVSLPGASGHLSVVFWILGAALTFGTAWTFRPTGSFRPLFLRAVIVSLLWLGFITYGITVII